MKLCAATNNSHKLSEIRSLLSDSFDIVGLEEIGCSVSLPEDQDTIEGNSYQKATYVAHNYSVNCFADDTGLEVNALDQEPGVNSARYAGAHRSDHDNMKLLLDKLVGEKDRSAQFKTVITLIWEGNTHKFEGILKGSISEVKKGENGFGYDPVFIPNGSNKTFGEMTDQEKNAISHRGIAIKKLAVFLKSKEH